MACIFHGGKTPILSKENPAGRAIEDLMNYFGNLVPHLKSRLSRILSAQESERHKHQKRPLVLDTKGSIPQTGQVGQALVTTTGLVWSSKGNHKSRALQQARGRHHHPWRGTTSGRCQNHPFSVAPRCTQLTRDSGRWAGPGGMEDDVDLKLLRGPLLTHLCLRALPSRHYRPPCNTPTINTAYCHTRSLNPAFIQQHIQNICNPLSALTVHAPMVARARTGRAGMEHIAASDSLPLHLQDPQQGPPSLALHSPTGTTLALLHLIGQADVGIHFHKASTTMEAAGRALFCQQMQGGPVDLWTSCCCCLSNPVWSA